MEVSVDVKMAPLLSLLLHAEDMTNSASTSSWAVALRPTNNDRIYATRVRHLRYGYTDSDLQRAFLQALDDFGYDEAFIGFVMAVCIRHELHITITRERERERERENRRRRPPFSVAFQTDQEQPSLVLNISQFVTSLRMKDRAIV